MSSYDAEQMPHDWKFCRHPHSNAGTVVRKHPPHDPHELLPYTDGGSNWCYGDNLSTKSPADQIVFDKMREKYWNMVEAIEEVVYAFERLESSTTPSEQARWFTKLQDTMSDLKTWHPGHNWEDGTMPWDRVE